MLLKLMTNMKNVMLIRSFEMLVLIEGSNFGTKNMLIIIFIIIYFNNSNVNSIALSMKNEKGCY